MSDDKPSDYVASTESGFQMKRRKPVRTPIQIAVSESEDSWSLVVLCDDGTMWLTTAPSRSWSQIANIPQIELPKL